MDRIKKRVQQKLKNLANKLSKGLEPDYIPLPSEKVLFTTLADGPVCFNIFIPSLDRKVVFGGIFTALAFIKEFQDAGFPIKITTFDYALNHQEKADAIAFLKKQLAIKLSLEDIQVVGEFKKSTPSKQEIFIATIYYTALFIQDVLKNNTFYKDKFVYFIQDFEPGFFEWSNNHARALSSYQGGNYYPVFNSSLLRNFFINQQYVNEDQCFAFKPQLQIDKLSTRQTPNQTPKMLFYARPQRPRNLYEIGLQGIIDWLNEFAPNVEIYTAGQPHDDIHFKHWTIRSLGKLEANKYWETLNQYDIGLSLMLSPHPSYPPIEMALSGVVVVTNRYAHKDLSRISDNFVSCEANAEDVKCALVTAYERSADMDSRVKNAIFDFDPELNNLKLTVKELLESIGINS